MKKKLTLVYFMGALLIPAAPLAKQQLAGLEIRNFKLDTPNRMISFQLVNTTDKWITAWAWRVEEAGSPDGISVRWYDNYPDVEIPGITSTPPQVGRRLRPGETREFTDPMPDTVSGISLVAVVFEDTTAVGEASVLDRLEKRRQTDIEVHSSFLAEIARIRASANESDALQEAIARIAPAPQNRNAREVLLRRKLEQIKKQLTGGQSPRGLLSLYETTANAQLERAKAQAHFRRLQ